MAIAKVIDNSGASASYGIIANHISIGEEVEVIYQDGCCYKIRKENGKEYTLNMERFLLESK